MLLKHFLLQLKYYTCNDAFSGDHTCHYRVQRFEYCFPLHHQGLIWWVRRTQDVFIFTAEIILWCKYNLRTRQSHQSLTKEAETISETLDINSILKQLIPPLFFVAHCCRKSFKSYIIKIFIIFYLRLEFKISVGKCYILCILNALIL
jgi:hypothetical protein